MTLKEVQELVDSLPENEKELINDSYHNFQELYNFRKMYNAALFNEWAQGKYYSYEPLYNVHKSIRHHDGELCFGGGWFIVSAMLPTGLISNHYKMEDWDLFRIPTKDKALYPFDGHTAQDVLTRLEEL
jgi:hypothetical protein